MTRSRQIKHKLPDVFPMQINHLFHELQCRITWPQPGGTANMIPDAPVER